MVVALCVAAATDARRSSLSVTLHSNLTFPPPPLLSFPLPFFRAIHPSTHLTGVKSVQRVVCGGCHDYKVVTCLDAEAFGAWEAAGFGGDVRINRSTYQVKPFYLSIETVLPIKRNRSIYQVKPFYLLYPTVLPFKCSLYRYISRPRWSSWRRSRPSTACRSSRRRRTRSSRCKR
jgi:hypothetical protein